MGGSRTAKPVRSPALMDRAVVPALVGVAGAGAAAEAANATLEVRM